MRRLSTSTNLSDLRTQGVQQLGLEIISYVTEHNFTVRDFLKGTFFYILARSALRYVRCVTRVVAVVIADWEMSIEKSVKERARPVQTAHLFALGQLAERYLRHLRPLAVSNSVLKVLMVALVCLS